MSIRLVTPRNHSGDYVRRRRLERGWSLADLARAAGYRNVSKGIRKLDALERGEPLWGIFKRLLEIPEFLDGSLARQLLGQDGPPYSGQTDICPKVGPQERVCMNCRYMHWAVGIGLGVRCEHQANYTDYDGPYEFYRQMLIPSRRFTCLHFEFGRGRRSHS